MYKNRFFESPPLAGFQKNDFGVTSTVGAGNTKIVFIMRIAVAITSSLVFYIAPLNELKDWVGCASASRRGALSQPI
ncbi:MAG: hypothetical protein ACK59J_17525 [Pseudanabaena sp.]